MFQELSAPKLIKLSLALGLGLILSACGQRGPLVAPTPNTNTQTEQQEPLVDQIDPNAQTQTKAPDQDFFLDRLL